MLLSEAAEGTESPHLCDHGAVVKHYTNGEITVVWKPDLCVHSGICARGLPGVFRPRMKPWIELGATDTKTIADQVDRCPSGALSWIANSGLPPDDSQA